MIKHLPKTVKIGFTPESITENIGVLALLGEIRREGLIDFFNKALPQRISNHSYKSSEHACTYLFSRLSGGYNLEDTRKISSDEALKELIEVRDLPKPNTLGQWFAQATEEHSNRVRQRNRELCGKVLQEKAVEEVAVDIDSKVHESDNKQAEYTYKGVKGYNPLYTLMPEHKLVYDAEFRKGSVSPQEGNKEAVEMVIDSLPESVRTVRFRVDSAGWQREVINAIDDSNRKGNGKRYEFFIRARNMGKIGGAGDVEREIAAIPSQDWRPYRIERSENETLHPYKEIAECVKTIGEGKRMRVYRMVVVREGVDKDPRQGRLFDGYYNYSVVVTNNRSFCAEEVYEFYNHRGGAEDLIGEIVEDGRCERFPMKRDNANSLWLVLSVLLHNLVYVMKLRALPKSWHKFTLKTLRYRILNSAVRVIRHARNVTIKIRDTLPWGKVLEKLIRTCWNPLCSLG